MTQGNDTSERSSVDIEHTEAGAQRAIAALITDGVEMRITRNIVRDFLAHYHYGVAAKSEQEWFVYQIATPIKYLRFYPTYHEALAAVLELIQMSGGAS